MCTWRRRKTYQKSASSVDEYLLTLYPLDNFTPFTNIQKDGRNKKEIKIEVIPFHNAFLDPLKAASGNDHWKKENL